MKEIRWESSQKIRYIKRSDIKKLLYCPLESMLEGQKHEDIKYYLEGPPRLRKMFELVSDFRTLLSGNDVNALDTWIEKAEALQIEELNSFLKLNQSDKEAVKNAIRYQYSNGPTEGCNNKIKVIKR